MKKPDFPADASRRRMLMHGTALMSGVSLAHAGDESGAFAGWKGTALRFAGVDTARRVLAADDDWMRASGDFQRRAVMGAEQPVTVVDFKRWNADAARAWPAKQRTRWLQAAAKLAPALNGLRLPLPKEVLLIHSNGQESAGQPYTRGNAIVLPTGPLMPGYSDAEMLAHELFHVISRHAPALADALYATIGFEPTPPLVFPAAWSPIRMANPDAPGNRHAMRFLHEGRAVRAMPVLVAGRTKLNKAAGETFFDVIDVRLLEVEPAPDGRSMVAVLRDGQPAYVSLSAAREYLQRLGGNTDYVIHPEEVMADNFAFLCAGRKVSNLDLLKRIEAALRSATR